jgi:hypothetical protein
MMRIYFLKFTSGSISVYYGWRYHCLIDSGVTNCVYDNIVEYPIGEQPTSILEKGVRLKL